MPEKINASHDEDNVKATENDNGTETVKPQDDANFTAGLGVHAMQIQVATIVASAFTAKVADAINKNDPATVSAVFDKIDALMAAQPEGGPAVMKALMWGFAHALLSLEDAGLLPDNEPENPEAHRGHGCPFDPEVEGNDSEDKPE